MANANPLCREYGARQTSAANSTAQMTDGLIEQRSGGKRLYTQPKLIPLDSAQIGTGATSSLAEANFGVFASAS